ncbi:MAG: SH3 domain-containing protein, partial [Candidatus Hydrogenedentes bacterium]|nr:SH3 domain-containing protein [Candidatus Hydrogenedentota bacterium]
MRQKRKIDKILLTTATVLVAALLVALLFRIVNDSKSKDSAAEDTGLTQPAWLSEEGIFNVEGLIDRHNPDSELIFLLDEVQAPVNDNFNGSVKTVGTQVEKTEPSSETAPSTPSTATETTTAGTTFRDVDIRYYVISKSGLNLREAPSTDAPVKQQLEHGKPLRVIGLSNEWAKIRLAGYEIGYVAKAYISQYPPVTTTTAVAATTVKTTTQAPATTRPPANSGQGGSPFQFVLS